MERYLSESLNVMKKSVEMATYAYNTSIQRLIGMTSVIFGKKVHNMEIIINQTTPSEYVERLQKSHYKI